MCALVDTVTAEDENQIDVLAGKAAKFFDTLPVEKVKSHAPKNGGKAAMSDEDIEEVNGGGKVCSSEMMFPMLPDKILT